MAMWYWSVAILFWQLSIDHIVNGQYKRYGFANTHLRHPSLPFDSLPYPTRTICRRVRTYVRTLGQSRDNQTKRGWPYSMSTGLCPTRASRARVPRYKIMSLSFGWRTRLFVRKNWFLKRGTANETTILQVRILTEKVLIKNRNCCRGLFTLLQTFQRCSTLLCLKLIYV